MRPRSPLYVSSLIAAAFFMENLDGTVIATALPQMARSFGTDAVHLNIGMTAYLITLAVFIPVSGWFADRFGARTVFASAIAIFTVASLLCGLADTLTTFTWMRVLQGIGGSMMVPVGRLIVVRNSPKEKLTEAIAYITWPALSALVLGPAVGGFITTKWSWRWIFALNLPLGILAFVLALLWINNDRSEEAHPFDLRTFVPAAMATTGAVVSMEILARAGERWPLPLGLLLASLALGVLAIVSARRRRSTAMIDFDSLRLKTFSLAVYGATLFRISVSVLPFLLPLMFQIGLGWSPLRSGLFLLTLFAGDLAMKVIVIPVLRRFGFRHILVANSFILAGSIAMIATIHAGTPAPVICAILFFHGAVRSVQFTSITTLAYTEVSPSNMARANSLLSALMQLSVGLGVSCGAVLLRLVIHLHSHSPAAPTLGDFRWALLLVALPAGATIFQSLRLPADAGALTSGHRHQPLEELVA